MEETLFVLEGEGSLRLGDARHEVRAEHWVTLLPGPAHAAFGGWLAKHHGTSDGLWLEVHKKGGTRPGPTCAEALEEALRFGWIDGRKDKLDAD